MGSRYFTKNMEQINYYKQNSTKHVHTHYTVLVHDQIIKNKFILGRGEGCLLKNMYILITSGYPCKLRVPTPRHPTRCAPSPHPQPSTENITITFAASKTFY